MSKSSVHVEFYMHSIPDNKLTAEKGRPIFKDVEYVQIRFPGDNKRVHVAPAHDRAYMPLDGETTRRDYTEMFPEHYDLFKKGESCSQIGTPLSELPFLTEAKRREFRAVNIETAEALAGLPDREIAKMGMGTRDWVNKAKAWIDAAENSVVTDALSAENAELRERMAKMEAMLADKGPVKMPDKANDHSEFEDWDSETIKAYLADQTGARPKGNPKHSTLVRLADEAAAEVRAA